CGLTSGTRQCAMRFRAGGARRSRPDGACFQAHRGRWPTARPRGGTPTSTPQRRGRSVQRGAGHVPAPSIPPTSKSDGGSGPSRRRPGGDVYRHVVVVDAAAPVGSPAVERDRSGGAGAVVQGAALSESLCERERATADEPPELTSLAACAGLL